MRECDDGYPTCRKAEAGGDWCKGNCAAWDMVDGMRVCTKVVKTEYGWEPAYWDYRYEFYVIKPGLAKPTRAKAEKLLLEKLSAHTVLTTRDK